MLTTYKMAKFEILGEEDFRSDNELGTCYNVLFSTSELTDGLEAKVYQNKQKYFVKNGKDKNAFLQNVADEYEQKIKKLYNLKNADQKDKN